MTFTRRGQLAAYAELRLWFAAIGPADMVRTYIEDRTGAGGGQERMRIPVPVPDPVYRRAETGGVP